MSKDINVVIEDLGRAFEEFKAENDNRLKEIEKKGHADPLLAEKVEKINAELDKISAMKKELEDLQTIISRGKYPGGGQTEIDRAKAEHKEAFEKWFRKGIEGNLKELEVRASLSSSSDPDGGFTVPTEMSKEIDRVASTISVMRQLATVVNISTDTYEKLVNQGGATSGWVGEKASRTETSAPQLAKIAINTKEFYANPAATQKLLDDSSLNIEQWLADEVATVFNEAEGDAFINGNGVEKPKGILGYTTVPNASYAWGKIGFIATGAKSTFTDVDKLIDLQQALKATYQPGAVFLMNTSTQGTVRKFKDGEGNYIWQLGLKEGAPNLLLGKPVVIDDNMPSVASDKYPIAYANFKRAYLIVDRFGVRVLRDPYTNKPYIHFYTTKRVGGGVVMYEAIKLLKVATS